MRVRYSNEIAQWKWPPIFSKQEGEIFKKEQTSWTSTPCMSKYKRFIDLLGPDIVRIDRLAQ